MKNNAPAAETVIRYSPLKLLGWLLFFGLFVGLIAYTRWMVQPPGSGGPVDLLIGLGCLFGMGRQVWLLFHNPPQLTVCARGIRLAARPLDEWEHIQGEEVRIVPRHRGSDTLLYYEVGYDVRWLNLRKLAISPAQLTRLLQHYRSQFHR